MRTALSGIIAMGALALPASYAAADCKQIAGDIRAALSSGATSRYDALFTAMSDDHSCDAKYRDQVGRAMARSLLTTLSNESGPDAIADTMRFGRPWQVLAALGDAYYDRQDWANAAAVYQEALTDMADAAANPTPPQKKVAERVQRRAVQAAALAPPSDLFASRAFETGGDGAQPTRDLGADAVPVLATFPAGSAELTPAAMASIKRTYVRLATASPKRLTIVGHADPSEAASLAEERAKAVGAYLVKLGYAGTIEVMAKGSSEPFAADEPGKFTEAQLYAFDRRVEYRADG